MSKHRLSNFPLFRRTGCVVRSLISVIVALVCFWFSVNADAVILFNGLEISESGIVELAQDDSSGAWFDLLRDDSPSALSGDDKTLEKKGRRFIAESDLSVCAVQKTLEPLGCNLVHYIGSQGFLLSFSEETNVSQILNTLRVRWISPLHPRVKADSNLVAVGVMDDMPILVHLFPDASVDEVKKRIEAVLPDTDVQTGENRIGFRCLSQLAHKVIPQIADLDDVLFIERDRGVVLLNRDAIRILQSGTHAAIPNLFEKGLFGEGQIAAVCDTGIDADSCYFRDYSETLPPTNLISGTVVEATRRKVIAVNFLHSEDQPNDPTHWDNHGHGTGVAGCVGASHISDPTSSTNYNGMAPLAQFVIQDAGFQMDDCADLPGLGCPVIDLTPIFQQAYLQGARFHNNSWGDRENDLPHNTYTARCQDIDQFTWNNKDFLVVCAAGNEGAAAGAVSSPSVAKNALSVGGSGNGTAANSIIFFSSHGPASDGRIKPDLVAPASVITARSDRNVQSGNCDLTGTQGTSFASPLAVGAACLVREYLQKGYAPTGSPKQEHCLESPSAALIKAMLINSCVNVQYASPVPAVDQGWGRIHLDDVMHFAGESRKLILYDIAEGFGNSDDEPRQWGFWVNSADEPLKITLVWSDYPAAAGAETHLVNDLNLSLHHRGTAYRGNNFSAGVSVADGSWDSVNNVEQILLTTPEPGLGQVTVIPHLIHQAPQDFALVITGDVRSEQPSSASYWQGY